MHVRENTDIPWQKPQQSSSAKANFEGCIDASFSTIRELIFVDLIFADKYYGLQLPVTVIFKHFVKTWHCRLTVVVSVFTIFVTKLLKEDIQE